MKNRTEKNVLRSSCGIFAAALVLLTTGAMTTWAAQVFTSGTACTAFNNNQANALERSHVRLLNPSTNYRSLWVICSPVKVMDSITSGDHIAWLEAFWEAGSTDDITCVFRSFDNSTVHIPGGNPDASNTRESIASIISNPGDGSTAATRQTNLALTQPDLDASFYWTWACNLPPGTGINQVGVGIW